MIQWNFNPANYKPNRFELVPPGDYRVRIEEVEEQESKSGYPMLKMTLKVSGYETTLWHFMVFMNDTAEHIQMTDNNLGRIFDSFGIEQGDLNSEHWKGKVGAAHVKNDPGNNGAMRAVIGYFIQRGKQAQLPPWQEGSTPAPIVEEMMNPDESIPF